MAGRLSGWWRLPPAERLLFLALLVALPVVSAMLYVLGVKRTRRWLERSSRGDGQRVATPLDLERSSRLAQLVEGAGRQGLLPSNCLRKSLLLYWLLRRRGLSPRFVLGVRKASGKFDAHAWVQLGDVPLLSWSDTHTAFKHRDWGIDGVN